MTFATLSVAAPKGPKEPPGPPSGSLSSVSQSCSASQSSISCCNSSKNKGGHSKNVYWQGGNAQLLCNQINGKWLQSPGALSSSQLETDADLFLFPHRYRGGHPEACAKYLLYDCRLLHWRWMRCYRQLGQTCLKDRPCPRYRGLWEVKGDVYLAAVLQAACEA